MRALQRDSEAGLGLLVDRRRSVNPKPPEVHPFGRAALLLEQQGVAVVFVEETRNGSARGVRAVAGGWRSQPFLPLFAAYNRYPAQSDPEGFATLLSGLTDVPMGNPPRVVELCRDKLRSQRLLQAAGIEMPDVEASRARFPDRIAQWRTAFLKPRWGSYGRGVHRIDANTAQQLRHSPPDTILQRGIDPPNGMAGVAIRALVQHDGASWGCRTLVARVHATDPVVNRARGAKVLSLEKLASPSTGDRCRRIALEAAHLLQRSEGGADAVEFGFDFVLDAMGRPYLIEVNGKPEGHLLHLGADPMRPSAAHVEACLTPLRSLVARYATVAG